MCDLKFKKIMETHNGSYVIGGKLRLYVVLFKVSVFAQVMDDRCKQTLTQNTCINADQVEKSKTLHDGLSTLRDVTHML